MDCPDSHCSVQNLLHLPTCSVFARYSLQTRKHLEEQGIPTLLQICQDSSLEEDLRGTDPENRVVELEGIDHTKTCFTPVHISTRDDAWGEDFVSLAELHERKAIRVSQASDTDAFQDTVAAKLVKNKGHIYASWLLESVGHDAANEMRLCRLKLSHKTCKLLLVPLAYCSESTLFGRTFLAHRSESIDVVGHKRRSVTELSEKGGNILLRRRGQDSREIIIERILVLLQPAIGTILDPPSVVLNNEPLIEARCLVLDLPGVLIFSRRGV